MPFRSDKMGGRISAAGLRAWAILGCLSMASCLGAGDDSKAPAPVVDAASDAKSGEGGSGGSHASEGGETGAAMSDAAMSTDGAASEGGDATMGAPPAAMLSATSLDFGPIGCGSMATQMLTITNGGGSTLAVSASKVGSVFTLNGTSLQIGAGRTGTLTLTAAVPTSAMAGTPVTGSLALFTNDPANSNLVLLLSATPTGAALTGTTQYAFASTEVMVPAPPVALQLRNTGNAAATFTFATPSLSSFSLQGLPGGVMLNPGDSVSATATFTPANASLLTSTVAITASGATCGGSVSTLTFTGQASTGSISGVPSTIDFGPVSCGGAAPAPQHITLTNSGVADVHITGVDTSQIGSFTTDATIGEAIPAGGALTINFIAPAGPMASTSLAQITGTVVLTTDAANMPTAKITLSEEPQGAILAFGSAANCPTMTANFGAFGSAGVLLQPVPPQSFCVVNSGNVAANVELSAVETGASSSANAGADGGTDAAGTDTTTAGPEAFSLLSSSLAIAAPASGSAPSVATDSLTFTPVHAGPTTGSVAMSVGASTPLCQPLPSPLPLSGSAVGGGPMISVSQVELQATCGGAAPAAGTITVANSATASVNLNWTLAGPTGPGASFFTVTASPGPGTLQPGQQAQITVNGTALPSPVLNPDPAALSAQLIVTTDVPFDPPHVISLTEVPVGDQLFVSVPDQIGNAMRFGQVPVATPVGRTFTVTNNANMGSSTSNVLLSVVAASDAGAAAYSQPATVAIGPGASATESVTFNAPAAVSYPAAISFSTSDPLCTPLPAAIVLSGTGTAGAVGLSASTLYFGTNPTDPTPSNRGLVNCGAIGTTQTLTISNIGSQTLNVTGLTLQKGSLSPFTLSPATTTLPIPLTISGSTSSIVVTLTPSAIPSVNVDPTSATTYSDTLTIATDAAGDTPHTVQLVMQPRGAVITGSAPPTTWSFGTIAEGSIGTFLGTTIGNAGNIPASVSLLAASSLSLPSVFGLQNNPVSLSPGDTGLVGQFTPNAPNASWAGQGVLDITADAFCSPLPMAWNMPQISLSGASTSNPLVSIAGSLVFPTTDCGSAPPGGQSVTLTNSTNQSYTYSVKFAAGAFYTFADGGSGMLAASGTSTIVINPKAVVPGAGVVPGSAPYADDLIVTVSTTPPTTLTQPISWTLNGAVLSLPQGAGPFGPAGSAFYVADTVSAFPLPISNAGTATATVQVTAQPSGAFSLVPTPVDVIPNIPALPTLLSSTASPACPSTNSGTATFLYSGPVCQPLPFASVTVDSCTGAYVAQVTSPSTDAGAPPSDSGTDAGGVDAGSDAGGGGPLLPCTSAGQANCVQCQSSPGNICSTTEALFVQLDINAGAATKAGPSPSSGCYVCLVTGGCIDAPKVHQTDLECDDLTGSFTSGGGLTGSASALCLDALECEIGPAGQQCALDSTGLSYCYCGSVGGPASMCAARGSSVNGACLTPLANGFKFPATDATDILDNYADTNEPSGSANAILSCAAGNACNQCLQ
jgi:hypothetical protein